MKSFQRIVIVFVLAFTTTQCTSQQQKAKITENTQQSKNTQNQIIVDVRTVEEWNNDGHADCSVNYPLDQFQSKIEELKKYDKVVLVCRSGNRAGIASAQLQNAGYTKEIENLGAWQNVNCEIQ